MKRRRAYIGNLRPRPNLADKFYREVCAPSCLAVKNYPNGDGIVVAQPKTPTGPRNGRGGRGSANDDGRNSNNPSSVYALVEFNDVDYAIQVLNGVQFDGRTLRVSREKTNIGGGWNGGGGGGGFGSTRWAGGGGGGSKGGFKNNNRAGKEKGQNSRESVADSTGDSSAAAAQVKQNEHFMKSNGADRSDEVVANRVESIVTSEISESSDEVAAAIACTAAMTLLSSVDAFGLEESATLNEEDHADSSNNLNAASGGNLDSNDMTNHDFQSRCKLSISDLLSEYGEQDIHWKQQKSNKVIDKDATSKDEAVTNDDFRSRCKLPMSDLLAEYGEQDADWKKEQHPSTNSNKTKHNTNANTKSQPSHRDRIDSDNNDNGMLAHFKKASIHVELVSFGYKYGAPSHSKKGFTYAHPLPPLDIRDLDRAPGHIAKFNGLSYLVKRALLNPSTPKDHDDGLPGEKEEDDNGPNEQSPMRQRANEIADEIIKSLVESIDEGGHGVISPITMTISIGSEYGRHRAVVLVEHLALIVRSRLRRNDGSRFNDAEGGPGNGIVKQPVSVGTRHRDIEAKHQDPEAFGEDLKIEARKAEKARRRQMADSSWDDDGW